MTDPNILELIIDPKTLGFLGGALVGFASFANDLADLYTKTRTAKRLKDNEAAQYFDDLSASMTKVVDALRAGQVPRIDGNKMNGLIHAFPEKTKRLSSVRSPTTLKASLKRAASVAKTLDAYILENVPAVEAEREQMLALIERIAGRCGAIAGRLRKPV